jgi:pyrroline-5-carboxylate reductase
VTATAINKLGFIGGGNMAEAIVRGLLDKKMMQGSQLIMTDKSPQRLKWLRETFPLTVVDDNHAVLSEADAVLFAVKPQNMAEVLSEIREDARPEHLFMSICAGTRARTIEEGLAKGGHEKPRVIRIMPNTPALIGEGMAGLSRGAHASQEDLDFALSVFRAVGEVLVIDEDQMDAMTALSGSGPAYVFYVIESLIEAGVEIGFSAEDAEKIVLKMVLGSAKLAHVSGKPVEELRRQVTSPGGTTAAGIAVLDEREVRDDFIAAVVAAELRGQQLGKGAR